MPKYRKKPIVIEAEVYKPGMEDGWKRCDSVTCQMYRNFGWECSACPLGLATPYIETLEGIICISEGDYIITGVMNERYPCKPDIFEMTYELVEE